MRTNGVLIVSLDFELFWGMQDVTTLEKYESNILGGKTAIPQLLMLFQKYGIHATWATVGCMFADGTEEIIKYKPNDADMPSYSNPILSSYRILDQIAGCGEESAPCFFATKEIEQINSVVGQEIGCHTFSHFYCNEKGQTLDQFSADLDSAVKIANDKGFKLLSIVLPRNQCNSEYYDIIKKHGFTSFRSRENDWIHERIKFKPLMKVIRLLDVYLPLSGYGGYYPQKTAGMWNFTGSRMYKPIFTPLILFEGLKIHRIKKQMLHAAKKKLVFHLWWHPHNIGIRTDYHLKQLESLFKYYEELKKQYGMISMNMQESASYFEKQ